MGVKHYSCSCFCSVKPMENKGKGGIVLRTQGYWMQMKRASSWCLDHIRKYEFEEYYIIGFIYLCHSAKGQV